MGCLRALFVQMGCLVLFVAALVLGFIYRRPLWDAYRRFRGERPAVVRTYEAPTAAGAQQADAALARLARRGGPAYVDLTAAELAGLLDRQLARPSQGILDSVRVALDSGLVLVRGVLDLGRLPSGALGPLAGRMDGRAAVEAGGALAAVDGGVRWQPSRLAIRDFPFPRRAIPPLLRALRVPADADGGLTIPGLRGVGDVRVVPAGVRLYRAERQ